jgi:DNA polymerase elongation subunit (family B)
MLNSAYGKYALDPRKFKNYFIFDNDDPECVEQFAAWRAEQDNDAEMVEDTGRFEIWAAPAPDDEGYYDVAVAASITSAARSILLRAKCAARRPIYCDTDSLICLELSGVPIDDATLGAWKLEGETRAVYIVGKKVYAAWEAVLDKKTGKRKHKIASKGAKLSANVIRRLALRKMPYVEWTSDAPNFSLAKPFGAGKTNFVHRKIGITS